MPTAGAPDLERDFGLSHAGMTLVVFVIPGAFALVVEPVLFLLADRYPRRWFVVGGCGVMAGTAVAAAIAPTWWLVAAALAVWACANGVACAIAQATLVDANPERRAQTMTRWTFAALLGDLLGPLLLAAAVALGFGWRGAFVAISIALGLHAIVLAVRGWPTAPPATTEDEEPESLWQSLGSALRDRVLMLWLFGMVLCDLLDEILVVLGALHLRRAGVDHLGVSGVLAAFVVGGALGLVILERMLAKGGDERRLLVISAVACAVAYAGWLAATTTSLVLVIGLAVAVGATSAPLYPLVAARAFARFPGRSGRVLAASHLFTPLGLAMPSGLGLLADATSTFVALAVLVAQPVGLAWLATCVRDRGSFERAE